jgi:hypothetical protein
MTAWYMFSDVSEEPAASKFKVESELNKQRVTSYFILTIEADYSSKTWVNFYQNISCHIIEHSSLSSCLWH